MSHLKTSEAEDPELVDSLIRSYSRNVQFQPVETSQNSISAGNETNMEPCDDRVPPTAQQWEIHRDEITRLYKHRPLKAIRAYMRERYKFNATPRMYKARFRIWDVKKTPRRGREHHTQYGHVMPDGLPDFQRSGPAIPVDMSTERKEGYSGLKNGDIPPDRILKGGDEQSEDHVTEKHDNSRIIEMTSAESSKRSTQPIADVDVLDVFPWFKDGHNSASITSTSFEPGQWSSPAFQSYRAPNLRDQARELAENSWQGEQQQLTKESHQPYQLGVPDLTSPQELPTNLSSPVSIEWLDVDRSLSSLENEDETAQQQHSDQPCQPPLTKKQIGPFTDSGYASGYNPDDQLPRQSGGSQDRSTAVSGETNNIGDENEDGRTSYSEETTKKSAKSKQNYISEICGSIYRQLEHHVSETNWAATKPVLPDLVKAFAIRLGLESTDRVNRDIMYFVHKNAREIAEHLDWLVLGRELPSEVHKDQSDGMSVDDKMRLWDSQMHKPQPSPVPGDLYEGVGDDLDNEVAISLEISHYSQVVMNSNSFAWLQGSLRRELSLSWCVDDSQEGYGNTSATVRQKLLEAFPTGKISRLRPPRTFEAEFRLSGWAQYHYRRSEATLTPQQTIFTSKVVVGSTHESQAISVKEYMRQTWPSSWEGVYSLLDAAIDAPLWSNRYPATFSDGSQISVSIDGNELIVSVVGPAHSIAECGEQLAWLRATLHDNIADSNTIIYCKPIIRSITSIPYGQELTKTRTLVRFDTYTEYDEVNDDEVEAPSSLWKTIMQTGSVVIRGYPVLRRPVNFPGFEISWEVLSEYLGEFVASRTAQTVVLKGAHKKMILCKQKDSVFLWHNGQDTTGSCSSCSGLMLRNFRYIDGFILDFSDFKKGRHIIATCEDISVTPSAEVSKSSTVRGSVCSSELEVIHAGEHITTLDLLKTTTASDIDRSYPVSESHSTPATISGISTPFYEPNNDIVNSGSISSSLDSDLLSVSETSIGTSVLDDLDSLKPVIDSAARRLFSSYRLVVCPQDSPCGSSQNRPQENTSTQGSSTTSTLCTSEPLQSYRKRKLKQTGNPDDSDEDDGGPPNHPKKVKTEPVKPLACPFWKLQPSVHRSCFGLKLTRVRDVKQHLNRKHTPAWYCDRCSTIFPSEQELHAHVSDAAGLFCTPCSKLDGISRAQRLQLSRKSNKTFSEEDQWFTIWDILFPGLQRPRSAYMDGAVAEDLYLFRAYCDNHSGAVLAEEIKSANLEPHDADLQRCLRLALNRGLDLLFEQWCASRAFGESDSLPVSSTVSSTQRAVLQRPSYDTSVVSTTDSGIASSNPISVCKPVPGYATLPSGQDTPIQRGATEHQPTTQAMSGANGDTTFLFTGQDTEFQALSRGFSQTSEVWEDGLELFDFQRLPDFDVSSESLLDYTHPWMADP